MDAQQAAGYKSKAAKIENHAVMGDGIFQVSYCS